MLRLLVVSLALLVAAPAAAVASGLHDYVGTIHGHSSYSDGLPEDSPARVFEHARAHDEDFFGISDHSDTLDVPISASQYCIDNDPSDAALCADADADVPANAFRKWPATQEYADAASTASFTAFRGFEWSSDRYGHINVLFSSHEVNAKIDGGYADMDTFYGWLKRPVGVGGGSDGIATFNHPGDKKLSTSDPAYNWNDFAYDPTVDDQMVGQEVFNSRSDFGSPHQHNSGDDGWYVHALDKGWHVGAVGAEDLGHNRGDDWGGPGEAKTVIAAPDRSPVALKGALRARRMYAVLRPGFRLTFTGDGAPMGARLQRRTGADVRLRATADAAEGLVAPGDHLVSDLITSGGKVVATSASGALDVRRPATPDERYYFLRVREVGNGVDRAVAFSSPVWITATAGQPTGEWLAGDLHVHTCFSRDVYCGPSDEPLHYEPDEGAADLQQALTDANLQAAGQAIGSGVGDDGAQAVTYGLDVGSRFAEAAAKGLDYLAISDHEDVRSSADPSFASSGVIGLPAYENSIDGHAQMLGASSIYDHSDVPRMIAALHADGGAFQANHPTYKISSPFTSCDDPSLRHWKYGYDVPVDSVETWNPTTSIAGGEAYLECRLQRGQHVAATGGGDSHWASLTAAGAGVGSPTTWLLAADRTPAGLLGAVRAGRTSISKETPLQGGDALLLEADADRDGTYEALQGDTVPPGTPMRLRSAKGALAGIAKVRANGQTLPLANATLTPGGTVSFTAPDQPGWVRADLLAAPVDVAGTAPCPAQGGAASTCTYDQLVLAMTSPLYLARAAGPSGGGDPGGGSDQGAAGGGSGDAGGANGGGGGANGGGGGGADGGAAGGQRQEAGAPATTGGGTGATAASSSSPAGGGSPRRSTFGAALRARRGQSARTLRRRGLLVQVGCDKVCRTTISVFVRNGRRLARRAVTFARPGRQEIVFRLPRATYSALRIRTTARSSDGQVRRLRLTVRLR